MEQKQGTVEALRQSWTEAAAQEKAVLNKDHGLADALRTLSTAVDALAESGIDIRVEMLSGLSAQNEQKWNRESTCPVFGFIHVDEQRYLFAFQQVWKQNLYLRLSYSPVSRDFVLPQYLSDAASFYYIGDFMAESDVAESFQQKIVRLAAHHAAVRDCDVAGTLFPSVDLKKQNLVRKKIISREP